MLVLIHLCMYGYQKTLNNAACWLTALVTFHSVCSVTETTDHKPAPIGVLGQKPIFFNLYYLDAHADWECILHTDQCLVTCRFYNLTAQLTKFLAIRWLHILVTLLCIKLPWPDFQSMDWLCTPSTISPPLTDTVSLFLFYFSFTLNLTIVCPSWVGCKKNLNNFRMEAATHPGFAPLESSRRSGYKYSLSNLQNQKESAIPKLNTKVYGIRKKTPQLSHSTRTRILSRSSVQSLLLRGFLALYSITSVHYERQIIFSCCV